MYLTKLFLLQISVDRGLNWEKALEKESQLYEPEEGFYLSYKVCNIAMLAYFCGLFLFFLIYYFPFQVRGEMYSAVLAEHRHGKSYNLYKPNIGKQSHPETLDSLRNKYYKVGFRG